MDHERLLRAVIEADASDLHCKPGGVPVLRVKGELQRMDADVLSAEDVGRLAQDILDKEQQEELLRTGSVVGGHSAPGIGRFRFAAYRQRGSVALVIHTVPDEIRGIDDLELPAVAKSLATATRGMVLVASPVGNGATTTLNALVHHANTERRCHIVTVEDPIEVLHQDDLGIVSQLEVGSDVRSLAEGVRAASRLDADVVAVSEIADRDTALAVLDAVARGRLVLAGIGGQSAATAIHTFLEPFAVNERIVVRAGLARSVTGVLAQRLLPDTSGELVPAVEALVHTAKVEACLVEPDGDRDLRTLVADGEYHGMQTMDQALVRLVKSGRIESDTALANAFDAEELRIELLR